MIGVSFTGLGWVLYVFTSIKVNEDNSFLTGATERGGDELKLVITVCVGVGVRDPGLGVAVIEKPPVLD